ncbi:hypothetical protein [Halobiforma nitratireducens]|uniref:Dihydrodipicolinate synthase n=1 Tax=Halobiforma nitratireducens JCM 10879 TaxID=1227454 RepID=M0LTD4_9EURY|nr:hypothetical protein [Halobiforma nitratireducens]EMA35370.1 hypothetical protein C446_12939 [Halobiforma nitratireducens JCM 10879]
MNFRLRRALAGITCPLVTPFDVDGEVDETLTPLSDLGDHPLAGGTKRRTPLRSAVSEPVEACGEDVFTPETNAAVAYPDVGSDDAVRRPLVEVPQNRSRIEAAVVPLLET